MNQVKTCNRCGEQKSTDQFGGQRNAPDGLRYACRSCCATKALAWRAANPERWKEIQAASYRRNLETVKQREKEYRSRPEIRARDQAKRRAHYLLSKAERPEKIKVERDRYLSKPENRERQRAACRVAAKAWRKNNPAKRRAYEIAYRAANPEIYRDADRRKRARRMSIPRLVNGTEILLIQEEQADRCVYCFDQLKDDAHVEHVVPLAKGGTDTPDNIAVSCKQCNQKKHAKSLLLFLLEAA